MAERHRSKDGKKETEDYIGPEVGEMQQGRSGGELARKVGARDEEKRRAKGNTSVTRVTKKDEKGKGNLGGLHGTGES